MLDLGKDFKELVPSVEPQAQAGGRRRRRVKSRKSRKVVRKTRKGRKVSKKSRKTRGKKRH